MSREPAGDSGKARRQEGVLGTPAGVNDLPFLPDQLVEASDELV